MLNNEKSNVVYNNFKMSKLREEQFKAFWTDRFVTCKIPVSDPILSNSHNLPGNQNKVGEKDSVLTAAMMGKLKTPGKARSELLEN